MKTKLTVTFLSFFIFRFLPVTAQLITIPDAKFVSFLKSNYPSCMSGDYLDLSSSAVPLVTTLYCENQNISDLTGVENFPNLKYLSCAQNSLSGLPFLSSTVIYLDISNNQFTNLPILPPNLSELHCSFNSLTKITILPSSLKVLECSYNLINTISSFPNSIMHLSCDNNSLSGLPALPDSLAYLNCNYNSLTGLPALPNALKELFCSYNSLASLPALPDFLVTFNCPYNALLQLPPLPASLNSFSCFNNALTDLPALPDSLTYFNCSNNPGLNCFPALKKFYGGSAFYFNISNTSIKCLPNKIQHPKILSLPAIDTMPICSNNFNPNNCPLTKCNAYFTLHPDAATPHLWYVLDESAGKTPISYSWIWGDGGSSTGATASHSYSSPGYYKICLTITDDTTCTSTYCDSSTYILRMEEDNAIITVNVVSSLPTTSQDVTTSEREINIYPNPANDKLKIENGELTMDGIEIKNLLGQTIYTELIRNHQFAIRNYSMDVSGLSPGIYFVHLYTASGDVIKKVVKE